MRPRAMRARAVANLNISVVRRHWKGTREFVQVAELKAGFGPARSLDSQTRSYSQLPDCHTGSSFEFLHVHCHLYCCSNAPNDHA